MALEFVRVGRTERMKVEIIRGVVADGRTFDVGEVADIPAGDALLLLSMGSAKKFVEPPKVEAKAEVPKVAPVPVTPELKTKGDKK